MRKGVRFFAGVVCMLLAVNGCATSNDPYAIMEGFAPNTPRPFPNPRMKPDPPRQVAQRATPRQTTPRRTAPSTRAITSDVVTVRRGDTVYALARRHDRTPRDIIDANDLKPPYTLFPGQKLRLNAPRYHIVQRGDTGYGISRRYGVELTALMRSNDLKAPYTLHVGQRLTIPGGASSATASSPPNRLVAVPPPPKRSSSRFAWPVQGTVISRFGPKQGGRHNDGINIRAPKGAPVRAAENGVVAYAGSDLRGFGNLLLIRHDGGWVTAYGHNQALLVKRGDTVERGQTIARVGDSGTSGGPQLHFEIRQGTKAVNPERHL